MAKKRKCNPKRKRAIKRANPAAPSFPAGRLVPVKAVRINKRGTLEAVVIEDKNLKLLKRGKRK